jgi:hypothetical protein
MQVVKLFFSILISVVILVSCDRADNVDEFEIASNIEDVSDKKIMTNGSFELSGAKFRSEKVARSGSHSILLSKKGQKALKGKIDNIGIGDEIHIQVWKSGKDKKNGELVLIVGHQHYFKKTKAIKTEGDWELLEFKITMPMEFPGEEMRWYVNNLADGEVFFDDFYLNLKRNDGLVLKQHPTLPKVTINIKDERLQKIESKRQFALDKGILISDKEDWVKTNISWNDEEKKAKIRLKGDWTDHLYGQKFSLRVNVSKGKTLNGYSKFSIQNPVSRYFLDEWFIHKVLEKEGVLTTRYEFIDLYINEESKGLYAVEEHFTNELLTYMNRKESPIYKFSEDDLWLSRYTNKKRDIKGIPWYASANIEAFSQKRLSEDRELRSAFFRGRELMFDYQFKRTDASKVVDTKKMAAFIALMDLSGGYHAMIWHNQRFYYNQDTDLLEPLVYDIFQESTHLRPSTINFLGLIYVNRPKSYEVNAIDFLFQNAEFVEWYSFYLEKFSEDNYFDRIKTEFKAEISHYEKEIQSEYSFYSFDTDLYHERAKRIKAELPKFNKKIKGILEKEKQAFYSPIRKNPEHDPIENVSIHAYLHFLPEQTQLQVQSFYYDELELIGIVVDKEEVYFEERVKFPAYRLKKAPATIEIKISSLPSSVLYKTLTNDSIFVQKIIRYKAPISD